MDKKTNPDVHNYEDIQVGQIFEFTYLLSEDDVNNYANLIGDFNPLHIDKEYAKTTVYKKKIAHGMLTASLFSTLLGMYCPGKNSIILSMNTCFKRPVFTDTKLYIQGRVISKTNALKIMTMELTVTDGKNILVTGKAKVRKF